MEKYCYPYPRPMVTVDIVLFSLKNSVPSVLLVQRLKEPYAGSWALPGGFVEMDEDLPAAAYRELLEETGLRAGALYQCYTVGTPGRDPRGRTISVVYSGFYDKTHLPVGSSDAKDARWHTINEVPALAFDHGRLIATTIKKWSMLISAGQAPVTVETSFLSACERYLQAVDPFKGLI